jgi:hypothetical protein
VARTVFKEVSYTLSNLLGFIDMGYIGLPELQRPFVWPNARVRDLFDSMYRGFPVGYLLFWESGADGQYKPVGGLQKQKAPRLLIVDGQQRLTSLYAVLRGKPVIRKDFTSERIQIAFRPLDQTFEVADAAIRRDPQYIPDISELWAGEVHWREFEDRFIARLEARDGLTPEQKITIVDAIDRLKDVQEYPFTALELTPEVGEEQVADVFVRINSKGMTLNQADFILTLMSVYWDEGRKQLEAFCRGSREPGPSKASPFNHYIQPDPDQMIRVAVALAFRRARLQHVYSVLRGKDMDTGEVSEGRRKKQFKTLQEAQDCALDLLNWHEYFKCLLRAGFRSGQMISSETSLLYSYALYLIGRRDYAVDPTTLRAVIARWFFMAQLKGRYTSSPETVMEQDLARLRRVQDAAGFVETLNQVIDDSLTQDYWAITLPGELETSSPNSPSLSAYHAALALLGAPVLLSSVKVSDLLDPAVRAPKAPLERHHLFPKGFLKKRLGIEDIKDTNQIANYALVEWSTNIEISDTPPAKYWPKELAAKRIAPADLKRMMHLHALPAGWESMDYREFLDKRRRGIAAVIREGFKKL